MKPYYDEDGVTIYHGDCALADTDTTPPSTEELNVLLNTSTRIDTDTEGASTTRAQAEHRGTAGLQVGPADAGSGAPSTCPTCDA